MKSPIECRIVVCRISCESCIKISF